MTPTGRLRPRRSEAATASGQQRGLIGIKRPFEHALPFDSDGDAVKALHVDTLQPGYRISAALRLVSFARSVVKNVPRHRTMLSENQKRLVVQSVNTDVDLPFISENSESRVIDMFVDKLEPQVEPSLAAILPAVYLEILKIALNERMSVDERRKGISSRLRKELAGPLAEALNERVDASMIPERTEGRVLEVVANKIIDEFVEKCVTKLDDEIAEEGEEANKGTE
jgi:hypothetical protein